MNIVYTLNNKFVPQVAASITSVCENNQNMDSIHFYIIHTDISPSNQKKLNNHILKYNRDVQFIELDDFNNYFDFNFDTTGWNPIVLARLLLDKLLPKKVKKVLYLDGDTIVRDSLQNLWNTNVDKYAIAASIEPTINQKRKNQLNMKEKPYYNAGVLLINLKKWREENTGEKIINYYRKNNGKLFANDQDAINASQIDNILTISPKYNFYNIFYQYPYSFLAKLCDYPYIPYDIYKEARNNPVIIHYLGEERPWRIGNTHKFKDDYLKYLSMTPWKKQGFEKGWRLYFICWNCFNLITKPFPKLRYSIIDALIPAFIKFRSKNLLNNQK